MSKPVKRPANSTFSASTSSTYSIQGSKSVLSLGAENAPAVTKEGLVTAYGVEDVSVGHDFRPASKPLLKSPGKISANDVADYFLSKNDETAGELISNLKLQKLLYYAQGFHLAITGRPLFSEPIEAWTHGPVVPTVYHRFKSYGYNSLPVAGQSPVFDAKTTDLLDEIYEVYGQFSAWKLRNMTHEEPPWKNAAVPSVIPHSALRSYFKTLLA